LLKRIFRTMWLVGRLGELQVLRKYSSGGIKK
jgi:hypothetical protein